MASKSEQGVIPFRFDFNPKDLKQVRYTSVTTNAAGNQNKIAVDVPIFQIGGSKSQLLYVLTKFRKGETILSWTNGQTLYANWSNQLEDTSEWDTISGPFPQSVAGFNDAMEAYLVLLFPADAWVSHRNMLMSRKKSMKESPSEFMSRVNFHDLVLGLLPGHPGAGAPPRRLSDYDKKHLLYDAVTEDYRYSFRKAGLVLATISLNDLIKYMNELYSMDDTALQCTALSQINALAL